MGGGVCAVAVDLREQEEARPRFHRRPQLRCWVLEGQQLQTNVHVRRRKKLATLWGDGIGVFEWLLLTFGNRRNLSAVTTTDSRGCSIRHECLQQWLRSRERRHEYRGRRP